MAYSFQVPLEKRKRLLYRLQGKSENISTLIQSKLNVRTVNEELNQYEDFLKMFLNTHYQYHNKLEDFQQIEDDNWFDEIDHNIFTFKHLVHNYIQDSEENRSKNSLKSSKSKKSSVSSGSRSSGSSTSIKEQPVKEKMRLADLMAEASYMKQKKLQEFVVEELKIKMEIEQTKSRVKIMGRGEHTFGEMDHKFGDFLKRI